MHYSGRPNSSATASDLWAVENWLPHFAHRARLHKELALLEHLFPLEWRVNELREPGARHQMRGDLMTVGGRGRLLALAAELLGMVDPARSSQIPLLGRLRCWRLYQPTKSELLAGPLLRPVGEVTSQPQGAGHGADYKVIHRSGVLVAEVKRLCTPIRQERIAVERIVAAPTRSGPLFTPGEHVENTMHDARRLYRRVRHAARQLQHSANKARSGASDTLVLNILFLDLDGNPNLVNLREKICQWMNLRWARSVDLVLFFDYGCRDNFWGTIAEPIYSRSGAGLNALAQVLPTCSRGHFHIGNLPAGPCEFPLPL